jgi:hypothetical protein
MYSKLQLHRFADYVLLFNPISQTKLLDVYVETLLQVAFVRTVLSEEFVIQNYHLCLVSYGTDCD